jgi:hypothetical protein
MIKARKLTRRAAEAVTAYLKSISMPAELLELVSADDWMSRLGDGLPHRRGLSIALRE